MNFLDKKVEEILKNHPSGEDFFNHLDDMIRGHRSIIDAAWDKLIQWCYDEHLWINRGIPTFGWNGLILTGAFGRAVFNYMPGELRKTFEQVILVNGGLRQEGVEAQILVDKIDIDDFILFDDSFYSGTTRDKIEKALKKERQGCKIIHTMCIYDGSKDPNVTSLYKYYKQMGRRIVYTCDCCGSIIDLAKQVGILTGFNAENAINEDWELKYRKYLCDKCSEKVLLFIRK